MHQSGAYEDQRRPVAPALKQPPPPPEIQSMSSIMSRLKLAAKPPESDVDVATRNNRNFFKDLSRTSSHAPKNLSACANCEREKKESEKESEKESRNN